MDLIPWKYVPSFFKELVCETQELVHKHLGDQY